MLGLLLQVVLILIVAGIILWGVLQLPIDATIKQIIKVAVIVVVAIWLVYILFGVAGTIPHVLR
jgi:hypothetical protein